MKIDFVLPSLGSRVTGGTWCVLRHANELVRRGHQVRIITSCYSGLPPDCTILAKILAPVTARTESMAILTYAMRSLMRKLRHTDAEALTASRAELLGILARKLAW